MYKYKYGVLGGTFDHFHLGHKYLLDTAFNLSGKILIGLATEKVYRNKFLSNLIEPYELRELSLKNYLSQKKYLSRADLITLNDIYGPTLDIKSLEAIFVTSTTLPNAKLINEERNKHNLPQLEIVTIPFRIGEDNKVITSERIRQGEINRDGLVYFNLFKDIEVLKLPPHLRHELRKPIGKVITEIPEFKNLKQNNSLSIAVGDIVVKHLRRNNTPADIEIYDFKTRRHMLDQNAFDEYRKQDKKMYLNHSGTISTDAVKIIKESIDNYIRDIANRVNRNIVQKIIIDGEEDLLTLPAILLAPLNSYVYYGQFDLNAMIQVTVTEEMKDHILNLLRKFE